MNYYPRNLGADGQEYHVLYEAAQSIKNVPGLTCEIGLREGGGTEAIVQGFLNIGNKHTHIAIDPYGSIPYRVPHIERSPYKLEYPNKMKMSCLPKIYAWLAIHGIDFLFFCMEDTEFFKRFADGVPTYNNMQKIVINEYALIYFDGPKINEDIIREIEFFATRTSPGGVWVFDDTGDYDHETIIHDIIINKGFKEIRKGHKWVYRKI